MKRNWKLILKWLIVALILSLCLFGCPQSNDSTPPKDVTNLVATMQESSILLTWTDSVSDDVYGYEVTWENDKPINRSAFENDMKKNSLLVAPGNKGCIISNVKNNTEYTFTVKAMDKSGNYSAGESVSITANVYELSLYCSAPKELTNKPVVVTVIIGTNYDVEKVAYGQFSYATPGGVLSSGTEATESSYNNKVWTFEITENGTYYVAAQDSVYRRETCLFTYNHFDYTAPSYVTNINKKYKEATKSLTLTWKDPVDPTDNNSQYNSPFDHVLISYSTNDGTIDSEDSEEVFVAKGVQSYVLTNIDETKEYYIFKIKTVDKLGNVGEAKTIKHVIDNSGIPYGFVDVKGAKISSAFDYSEVFIEGRTVEIKDFLMADHEVTQGEFESICGNSIVLNNSNGDDYPVYNVSCYDAYVYCNKLSIQEDLTPCYKINNSTDPDDWGPIPDSLDATWAAIECDFTANGFRLPTEVEWEYAARGGNGLIGTQYKYSGSDTLDDVAWYADNSKNKIHEVKTKAPNGLGLYDMTGNVYEICWDEFSSPITTDTPITGVTSSRDYNNVVIRGQSYQDESWLQVFNRTRCNYFKQISGFRVVRTKVNL